MSAGFSALLIPDECGHRALEETLADWREERARAESAFGRAGADLGGLAGIARVLAMTAGAGLGRADVWRFFAWTMIASAIASAILVSLNAWPPPSPLSSVLLLIPSGMVLFGGFVTAFGLGLSKGMRVPGLTLCALMIATSTGLAGYVVPKANEIFRQQLFAQFSNAEAQRARPARLPTGTAEQSAAELLRKAMSDDRSAARRALLQRLAVTLSPVALLLLGAAFRVRFSRVRSWPLTQAAGGVLALAVFIGAAVACVAIQQSLPPAYAGRALSLPWWTAIVVSLLATLWLSRQTPASSAAD